jgi:hypothetical protein
MFTLSGFVTACPIYSTYVPHKERERSSFNFLVKRRICEYEVLKPKKKDKRLHVKTKIEKQKNNQTKKKHIKPNPEISPVSPKYPSLVRSDWNQGQMIAPRWYIGL